jgi:hypothetical protein
MYCFIQGQNYLLPELQFRFIIPFFNNQTNAPNIAPWREDIERQPVILHHQNGSEEKQREWICGIII